MSKRKVLAIASCAALLGLTSASFADGYNCPSYVSSATSTCLSKAATQQFISNFNNYFSTAQNLSQFNNDMSQRQAAQQPAQKPQQIVQQTQQKVQTNQNNNIYNKSYLTPKNTKPYIAPVVSNSNDKKQQKINWF